MEDANLFTFPKMQGLFTTMMIWKSGHIDSLFLLTSCFAKKMTFISAKAL